MFEVTRLYSRGFRWCGETLLSVDYQDGHLAIGRYDTLKRLKITGEMSIREYFDFTRGIRPELVNAALDAIGEFILTGELK